MPFMDICTSVLITVLIPVARSGSENPETSSLFDPKLQMKSPSIDSFESGQLTFATLLLIYARKISSSVMRWQCVGDTGETHFPVFVFIAKP